MRPAPPLPHEVPPTVRFASPRLRLLKGDSQNGSVPVTFDQYRPVEAGARSADRGGVQIRCIVPPPFDPRGSESVPSRVSGSGIGRER